MNDEQLDELAAQFFQQDVSLFAAARGYGRAVRERALEEAAKVCDVTVEGSTACNCYEGEDFCAAASAEAIRALKTSAAPAPGVYMREVTAKETDHPGAFKA